MQGTSFGIGFKTHLGVDIIGSSYITIRRPLSRASPLRAPSWKSVISAKIKAYCMKKFYIQPAFKLDTEN